MDKRTSALSPLLRAEGLAEVILGLARRTWRGVIASRLGLKVVKVSARVLGMCEAGGRRYRARGEEDGEVWNHRLNPGRRLPYLYEIGRSAREAEHSPRAFG